MAFRTNSYQQLSFADSFEGLTFREQKALEHSWAKVFAEDIFPAINEEPFRVLYSSNASRPNTPVNVCIGALIIKNSLESQMMKLSKTLCWIPVISMPFIHQALRNSH